jgi:Uncharacterized protein conserved in bacteria
MTQKRKPALWIACGLTALALIAGGILLLPRGNSTKPHEGGIRLLLDGAEMKETVTDPEGGDGLRVIVTVDGEEKANLPFGTEHTLQVVQDSGRNTVKITRDAVYMEEADCHGQDCVKMEPVTRDNLEMRVMGGFIICLPHRVSVEVRGN